MQKINFQNLPNTTTPISATNLNGMQDNIEESVVYTGTTQPSTSENVWFKYDTSDTTNNAIMRKDNNTFVEFIGKNVIADIIYPIGSIYISVNSTSPSTLFGGTWQRIEDVFLLGASSTSQKDVAGDTGGEETHTLTINEMPTHNHAAWLNGGGSASGYGLDYTYTNEYRSYDGNDIIDNRGGGQAHNNMPPYLVVYMWKRTA